MIPPANSTLGGEEVQALGADSIAVRTLTNPPLTADWSWTEPWRRAEIPAAGGHGNARSVARVQSVLSHGGEVDGVRLLSEAGCDVVFEQQSNGTDLVLQAPLTLGMGYGISSPEMPIGPNDPHLLLGRVGRLGRHQRPRQPVDRRVRDEPDGRGHDRRRPRHRDRVRRLRRGGGRHRLIGPSPS